MFRHCALTFYILHFAFFIVRAQTSSRIELLHADISEFDAAINPNADRLIGNVSFRHDKAIMKCDSAYLYKKENNLEAFGNVRIERGDTLTLKGKYLLYTGDTRMAQMKDDVEMTDRKMRLNTNRLDYNMNTDIGFYPDSGRITDAENILTSKRGYYYSTTHDLYFRYNVVLVNPKFTLTCDTLKYNTSTEIAYFLGPTYIRSKENFIYCETGWYHTQKQTSLFTGNSYLKTKAQTLRGDTIKYDRIKAIGIAINHVSIFDSTNKITITGDYGEHHEQKDSSFVTGHATMIQAYEKDSLFMHGDTLKAVRSPQDTTKRNLFAFHHVKMYKTELQGSCDSLLYNDSDSTIYMFGKPLLWSGVNQLSADSISIQTANSNIDKMHLVNSSFIVSKADSLQQGATDSLQFNQIRGKNMTGYFKDNKLYRIDVMGNGQTIYYTKNKKEKVFGVNRADCSDLIIFVNENKVSRISLLNQPDGTLYPVRELSPSELRLKGFFWAETLRPKNKGDIY